MLATIADRTFERTSLFLDGGLFVRCHFVECQMIYEGRDGVDFRDCTFERCSWTFDDAAERTIGFLSTLHQKVGPDGPELVEGIFKSIRDNRIAEVTADAIVVDPALTSRPMPTLPPNNDASRCQGRLAGTAPTRVS
jgi:hypothetical protein